MLAVLSGPLISSRDMLNHFQYLSKFLKIFITTKIITFSGEEVKTSHCSLPQNFCTSDLQNKHTEMFPFMF